MTSHNFIFIIFQPIIPQKCKKDCNHNGFPLSLLPLLHSIYLPLFVPRIKQFKSYRDIVYHSAHVRSDEIYLLLPKPYSSSFLAVDSLPLAIKQIDVLT